MSEPEKNKRKNAPRRFRRGWLVLIGVGIVFAAVGLYGFNILASESAYMQCYGTVFPSPTNAEIFFKLPPSAEQLIYGTEITGGGHTCAYWTKFEMSPDDLESFQASTMVEDFWPLTEDLAMQIHFPPGWVESFPSMGYSGVFVAPHISQQIFIETSDPGKFLIYIQTYSFFRR